MVGNRCYFRNCKVKSYNRYYDVHFYRFPLKDRARCDQWIKYTQQQNLYSLPEKRQRFMTICDRHFRDEYFMNYKKKRLTPIAIPTIQRLSQTSALDFEQDADNGVMITLSEPQQAHLRAPPGFECPFKYGYDADISGVLKNDENLEDTAEEIQEELNRSANEMFGNERVQIVETIEIKSAPKDADKRQTNSFRIDEMVDEDETYVLAANRIKADDSCSLLEDNIVMTESSKSNSQPIIKNHHIMDTEKHIWLSSDAFKIEDSSSYHFKQKDDSEEQLDDIDEFERDDEQYNENTHLRQVLETAFLDIKDLKVKLKNETVKSKKLENELSASRLNCQGLGKQFANQKDRLNSLKHASKILISKLQVQERKYLKMERQYQQQIATLEQSLDFGRQQLNDAKNDLTELNKLKSC